MDQSSPPSQQSLAGSAAIKGPRVLACVLCQHRKIKCDRHTPCANCVKANVACTPSTPAPARKRRRPNQDLQERLARCEELLKQYASGSTALPPELTAPPPAPESPTPTRISTASTEVPYLQWKPAGNVVAEDGKVRFMDSYLWATVYDELQAMRNIVEYEDDDQAALGSDVNTPDDTAGLLLGSSASSAVDDSHPEPVQTFRLWQVFLDRVNPLTKVIHVPTVQPMVLEAATNPSAVAPKAQALMFSIYCMAVTSLTDDECQQALGLSRDDALARFHAGFRSRLNRSSFLTSFDMQTVQALFLYLLSIQGRQSRHAMWILNGVVVRIAQKLGFHRDGEFLDLMPFETEMQRRIWWQVVMQDAKLAMQSGLSHCHLPGTWDTKLPQNLNDADLLPGSKEPVVAREGPTEMAFSIVSMRMAKFILGTHGVPGYEAIILGHDVDTTVSSMPITEEAIERYRAMTRELEDDLKAIGEKYIDPSAGPFHAFAAMFRNMVVDKLWEVMVPLKDQAEYGTEIFGPKDNIFKLAVTGMESALFYYNIVDKGFLWYLRLHFQVDVFAVLLGQLMQRTQGSLVDRAWAVVDKTLLYHADLLESGEKNNLSLGVFALKAWKVREQALRDKGIPVVVPVCISKLREMVPAGSEARTTGFTPTDLGGGGGGQAATASSRASSSALGRGATPASSGSGSGGGAAQQPGQQQQQQQQQQPDVGHFDQYLNESLGVTGLDWDMFDNMSGGGTGNAPPGTTFGGFGSSGTGFGW